MRRKTNGGFSLMEIIITIALFSLVSMMAFGLISFSSKFSKVARSEMDLQADMRTVSTKMASEIRDSTVSYAVTESLITKEGLKGGWDYIKLSTDKTKVELVTYNFTTSKHETTILIDKQDGITYRFELKRSEDGTNKLGYTLVAVNSDGSSSRMELGSELMAMNALNITNLGTDSEPPVALAYRKDDTPLPTTNTITAKLAVAIVCDNSGSMNDVLGGTSVDKNKKRLELLKSQANTLLDKLYGLKNASVCIVPFSNSANGTYTFTELSSAEALTSQKTIITNMTHGGGTNLGDGLRRGYYALKAYNDKYKNDSKVKVKSVLIIIADGNPTFWSEDFTGVITDDGDISGAGESRKYYTANNVTERLGSGGSDTSTSQCLSYAKKIASDLVLKSTYGMNGYFIGLSGYQDEVRRMEDVAKACNKNGTKDNYYSATDSISLNLAFSDIIDKEVKELWHIYGPYSAPK